MFLIVVLCRSSKDTSRVFVTKDFLETLQSFLSKLRKCQNLRQLHHTSFWWKVHTRGSSLPSPWFLVRPPAPPPPTFYAPWVDPFTHRLHRVATAAFWRTFHHEGKIIPGWWGGGEVHAHPLSLHLSSLVKLQCTLQLGWSRKWIFEQPRKS